MPSVPFTCSSIGSGERALDHVGARAGVGGGDLDGRAARWAGTATPGRSGIEIAPASVIRIGHDGREDRPVDEEGDEGRRARAVGLGAVGVLRRGHGAPCARAWGCASPTPPARLARSGRTCRLLLAQRERRGRRSEAADSASAEPSSSAASGGSAGMAGGAQSPSLPLLQPAGQQPSPWLHAVTGVPG